MEGRILIKKKSESSTPIVNTGITWHLNARNPVISADEKWNADILRSVHEKRGTTPKLYFERTVYSDGSVGKTKKGTLEHDPDIPFPFLRSNEGGRLLYYVESLLKKTGIDSAIYAVDFTEAHNTYLEAPNKMEPIDELILRNHSNELQARPKELTAYFSGPGWKNLVPELTVRTLGLEDYLILDKDKLLIQPLEVKTSFPMISLDYGPLLQVSIWRSK